MCLFKLSFNIVEQVVALCDYEAEDDAVLSFKRGDTVTVIDNAEVPDGCLYGKIRGKSGLFQTKFVKMPCVSVKGSYSFYQKREAYY